jgi:hypothetical protein
VIGGLSCEEDEKDDALAVQAGAPLDADAVVDRVEVESGWACELVEANSEADDKHLPFPITSDTLPFLLLETVSTFLGMPSFSTFLTSESFSPSKLLAIRGPGTSFPPPVSPTAPFTPPVVTSDGTGSGWSSASEKMLASSSSASPTLARYRRGSATGLR